MLLKHCKMEVKGGNYMIQLGFDKQCITPTLPVHLYGFPNERIATEVHDDLFTRVMVFKDDSDIYVYIQFDLLKVDQVLIDLLVEKVKHLGIQKEHLVFSSTHTHYGPGGFFATGSELFTRMQPFFGEGDFTYIEFIADKIYLAIQNSRDNLTETYLKIGRSSVENVGKERHNPNLEGDTSILVYEFTRIDGKKVLLYNYACHPTVTGSQNCMITKDLPYPVERDLPHDMIIFVNGNCGDISTRFTRNSNEFSQLDIFGKEIIAGIYRALENPEFNGPFLRIKMKQFSVELPIRKVNTVEEEQKKLNQYRQQIIEAKTNNIKAGDLRLIESYAEGAEKAVLFAQALAGLTSETVPYSIITIEHTKIVTVPGELFSTLGKQLKRIGYEVFGYTNGYFLYLADTNSYDQMFYEAMSSPFERGAGEILIKSIKEKGEILCQ